jgi:hypothetical protein
MMKTLHAVLTTVTNCLWWAGVFLACRIAVWLAAKPAWWTIPAALAAGTVWLGIRAAANRTRSGHGDAGTDALADPGLRTRMAAAWKHGSSLLAGSPFKSAHPLYLFFDLTRNDSTPVLELGDASDSDTADFGDEFTWYRGPGAVWIDYPAAHVRNDGGRWAVLDRKSVV